MWGLVAWGAILRAWNRSEARGIWLAIAILALGCAAETIIPVRFVISNWLRQELRAVGGEEAMRERRVFQVSVILFLLVLEVYLILRVIRWRLLTRSARIALCGVVIGATGFVLELISLHHLDQSRLVYPMFRILSLCLATFGVVAEWRFRNKSLNGMPT